jgi:7,8-dihydroneopterin aldolase/epimerase/oxygenase
MRESSFSAMNSIFIQDLKVKTKLGVPDWERLLPQSVLIDIEIALPNHANFNSDNIQDTIDYGEVCAMVERLLGEQTFKLVETMAEQICQHILQDFKAPWVRIKISKPNILRSAKAVGVIMERGQRPQA